MGKSKTININTYRRKWHINIGLIIFGVIFIYLIVTIIMYLTNPKVSIYEVREGSIVRDTAYTGIILREEKIIKSEKSGFINYLAPEASKVGAKSLVYSISDEKLKFSDSTDDTETLTSEEQDSLLVKTQNFSENYSDSQFQDIYALKSDIESTLESKSSQNKLTQISEMQEKMKDKISLYRAVDDGIVVYSTDGYENLNINKINETILSKKKYEKKLIKENTEILSNTPVYKLITNDKWSIVIGLTKATAKELKEKTSVKVRFIKDNLTANAQFSIEKSGDLHLGILTFTSSMIRYAQERYLDIELILEDESGLKIPKSSVVKKEFYLVPTDYLTYGGNSNDQGVLLQSDGDRAEFQPVSIYYEDIENGMVYLDPNEFNKKIILVKPDSSDTYQLGQTRKLEGVYNINKGYALFKQIKILCESDEYYIVEKGSDYGLSNYDHIALDGNSVTENDVVF